jgi:CheY-like chemotaxis protein
MPSTDTTDAGENGSVDFTGKRLLLAEDNDLNAEIAIFVLEDAGFEVERAEDGVKCFDMIVKHEAGYYDLILMDIQMPNLDGYGATEKIRQLDDEAKANIPIVALTANAFKEDQEKAFSVGMNAHLAKPIDVEKTLSTLCDILK